MLKLVKWDTENLGYKVGSFNIIDIDSLDVSVLIRQAKAEGYDVIYIYSPTHVQELEEYNIFYDEKIIYTQFVEKQEFHTLPHNYIKSYKNQVITPDLINLSLESGVYSRYNLDPNFPDFCYRKLYSDWIKNSINGDFAKDVLVFYDKERILGLLTYSVEANISSIGIIAVNPDSRGKKIGTQLIDYYKSILPFDVNVLNVVTQGVNTQAKNFYEKNGYKIGSISYVYHLWIK